MTASDAFKSKAIRQTSNMPNKDTWMSCIDHQEVSAVHTQPDTTMHALSTYIDFLSNRICV